jgi:2-oxoglutarate ferredoxin oxidoreductase subunit gamma
MNENEIKIRLIGAGGHGILTLGRLIGETAIRNGKESVMTLAYSPAQRGGWSRADVIISEESIDYPIFTRPDILVTTTQETYELESINVPKGKSIIYESSLVEPVEISGVRQIGIPAISKAIELGSGIVANVIILGFMNTIFKIFPDELLVDVIRSRVKKKYLDMNLKAFEIGMELGKENVLASP